jgi:hypothetical protein
MQNMTNRIAGAALTLLLAAGAVRAAPADASDDSKALLDLLVLNPTELRLTGLFGRADLRKVSDLYMAGDYDAALEAYRGHLLERLAWTPVDGVFRLYHPINADPKAADLLLNGVMMIGGKEVPIGQPGAVNWTYPLTNANPISYLEFPAPELFTGLGFAPLLDVYTKTRDRRYLDRWVAYMEDWCANEHYLANIHGCLVPSVVNARMGDGVMSFTALLGRFARAGLPPEASLPPRTLFKVIRKYLREFPLTGIAYTRSNPHNWTPTALHVGIAFAYDEFRWAPAIMREGRRRNIEDNAVTQNLRDGAENQQCPWYNDNYVKAIHNLFALFALRDGQPAWTEPVWVRDWTGDLDARDEMSDHLADRVAYQIHLRTARGEWPIPFRGGDKRQAGYASYSVSPEAYRRADVREILRAFSDATFDPSFNADWYPYAGYNIVRDGWHTGPRSGHAAMFSSPMPGAYGAYRSRSNNNVFGLEADDQDLLVDDTIGHYMYPSAPIRVDGKDQFFHAKYNIYKAPDPANHKSYLQAAWLEPAPWRWHASRDFNLMEGIYDGPYGGVEKTGIVGNYGPEEARQATLSAEEAMQGITHQRLALYAREPRLWILVDRLAAQRAHTYEQLWWIPASPGGNAAFATNEIVVDAAAQSIYTVATSNQPSDRNRAPALANMTMRQFSPATLSYARKNQPRAPIADGRVMVYGLERIAGSWTGTGAQQVVTAIWPRPLNTGPMHGFASMKTIAMDGVAGGFEAQTANGVAVRFLAARTGVGDLDFGDVKANAEALLLYGTKVMVLGARGLQVGGRAVAVEHPDFEFEIAGKKPANVIPIHRPIDPVIIGPPANVFDESVSVTMNSRTPGVRIRYTLDGSDPTPQSPLYTGRLVLVRSSVVKARAYREGVAENPPTTSGTQATPVSLARFERSVALASVTARHRPEPGLSVRYWEGPWKELWLDHERMASAATGTVDNLWNFSIVPGDNPPVGDQPTPRARPFLVEYSGYLDIPADGVYTFHAPREWTMPDTEAGYDLQVYLGEHRVPWGYRTEVAGLNQWYPSTRIHGFGTWSINLRKGLHPFRVTYLDYRTDAASKMNQPGLRDYIWTGAFPDLKLSGPGLAPAPIPAAWLKM